MTEPATKELGSPTLGNPLSRADRLEMIEALEDCIKNAEYNRLTIKTPSDEGKLQRRPGMHFHFKPEIFLQMSGWTEFELPKDKLTLRPGEVAVMPPGAPHKETIFSDSGAFRNLVVGFYSNAISIHLAYEAKPKKPDIDVIEFYDAPNLDVYLTLVSSLIEHTHRSNSSSRRVIKGLSVALFSMLKELVETGSNDINKDIGKVFHAKWLIREQISNTELNVKNLAERLQCSPDYLSHLFHSQTGEKLIHYIQRIRIEGAALALQTTPLYVSEIAWSSGFADAAYFARVFKKFTGLSPQEYRASKEKKRASQEGQPKTIYYDREDFSPGKPARAS